MNKLANLLSLSVSFLVWTDKNKFLKHWNLLLLAVKLSMLTVDVSTLKVEMLLKMF